MTASASLPDLAHLLPDLHQLVEIESPSGNAQAIARVMDVVEGWARALGAEVEHLSGGTRSFLFGLQDRPALILTHADTVWPHGTLETMPFRVEGDRLYGPGTYDMKAGIVSAIHALRALHTSGGWPAGGVQLLITPDEETGSHSSRAHIEAAARQARAVLVVEPPVADSHALKTGRKGVGSFVLTLHGVASHAGNKPEEGASAVAEAARLIPAIHALARPDAGTNVSVGLIRGGSAVNVIPARCVLEVDVRAGSVAEGERVTAGMHALTAGDPRVRLELTGGLNRPPFERGPQTMALYARAQALATGLGFQLTEEVVGGGSDGNFTAPLSPTLDGLGAPGDGAHAAHEHVRLDRWPLHVALLTGLLREV
ncbi:M20 family metallopeptidase [Deinococcus puniceus]|uniref:Carboxypeptidase n=1 Tax=Deinococcus puniceus TaxID=1182568 RepID=A0A172TC45_9DEIO|nr:M20 family metallopeptidase [Deinococcus puniceus]ANE44532.1 carboxypeptidase [Deinococcus puniceus]